jgi:hypothetical protein
MDIPAEIAHFKEQLDLSQLNADDLIAEQEELLLSLRRLEFIVTQHGEASSAVRSEFIRELYKKISRSGESLQRAEAKIKQLGEESCKLRAKAEKLGVKLK